MSTLYRQQGQLDRAEEMARRSLFIAEEIGDRSQEGISLERQGIILWLRLQLNEAAVLFEQSLAIAREFHDILRESISLGGLGGIRWAQARLAEAEALLREAIEVSTSIQNQDDVGVWLGWLGAILGARGEVAQGQQHLHEGERLLRSRNRPVRLVRALTLRGMLEIGDQNQEKAKRFYEEAKSIVASLQLDESSVARQELDALQQLLDNPS